jgi:hypothetical protein
MEVRAVFPMVLSLPHLFDRHKTNSNEHGRMCT